MPTYNVSTQFKGIDRVSNAFINMGRNAQSFRKKATGSFKAASKQGSLFGAVLGGNLVSGGIQSLLSKAQELPKEFKEIAQRSQAMETAFRSVFGKDSQNQLQFVRDNAFSMGLEIESASNAYKDIAAAAKGSAIANTEVQKVFIGVSKAATSLQLDSEKTGGALTALSQMISKGKVQAEELRGQLGERIPGAFQIAARAMNMTTGELDKFMSDGKLTAEKFIPAFANQLEKEFGKSAIEASKSFQAAENRFKNVSFFFKRDVGTIILPALSTMMTEVSKIIKPISKWAQANRELLQTKISNFIDIIIVKIKEFTPMIKTAFNFIKDNRSVIIGIAKAFLIWKAATLVTTIALQGMNVIGIIGKVMQFTRIIFKIAKAKGIWTAAQWALNVAMSANPVGLIIAGVTALIAVGVLLYKNWDKIKDFFAGLFPVFKKVGETVFKFLITPIKLLLGLIAKIPGVGKFADMGLEKINQFENKMFGNNEPLISTNNNNKIFGNEQAPNRNAEEGRRQISGNAEIGIRAEAGTEVVNFNNGLNGVDFAFAGTNQ